MHTKLLMGLWRTMLPIPRIVWHGQVSRHARGIAAGLDFMTEEHHLVRDFVVRELPRVGKPLSSEFIGQTLNLPTARVNVIVDELEKHLMFLFRNERKAVTWAYPVTVDTTPHHITFSAGEQVYAA